VLNRQIQLQGIVSLNSHTNFAKKKKGGGVSGWVLKKKYLRGGFFSSNIILLHRCDISLIRLDLGGLLVIILQNCVIFSTNKRVK
jgi:hypothetical protein